MKVYELIECLKDFDPDAWVHMHLENGNPEIIDHVRACDVDSKGRVILLR